MNGDIWKGQRSWLTEAFTGLIWYDFSIIMKNERNELQHIEFLKSESIDTLKIKKRWRRKSSSLQKNVNQSIFKQVRNRRGKKSSFSNYYFKNIKLDLGKTINE